MTKTNFEKLDVYRLSETIADMIWDIVDEWQTFARDTVGKQIVRAADSIGANIAEGVGRSTHPDKKRFGRIRGGFIYETKHWLRRAYRRKLLTQKQVEALKPLFDELAPRLNAYLKSIGRFHEGE